MADDPTDLSGLVVTPPVRQGDAPVQQMQLADPNTQFQPGLNYVPPGPGASQGAQPNQLNYNNSAQSGAVQDALTSEGTPQGGSANPGIYGLLPQGLQHGTLRNVLGALGDAFLVQAGHAPTYGPRMEQQKIGQAMAGYNPNDPDSVQAAIQRVAATGSPGAAEMADRMQKNASEIALRKQLMEQNNAYRQSMTDNRNDNALQRMTPLIGGMVAGATDKASYTSAYQRAEAIAQRIGPQYHASDFGLVDPQDWTPGATATAGLTHNNLLVSGDKAAQRQVSMRNTNVNAASRVQAAGISAGRPQDAAILQNLIAKQNSGQALTPAEQAAFNHFTQVSKGGRSLPPGLVVGGGAAAPPGGAPQASDVNYLRAHPQFRAQFDHHFGAGASNRYLGH